MKIKYGCTRIVILIGSYAIKFPTWQYDPSLFLKGLLANYEEGYIYKNRKHHKNHKYLCPVIFTGWLGCFLVMKRANVNVNQGLLQRFMKHRGVIMDENFTNCGMLNNRPVIIDYGEQCFCL